MKNVNSFGAVYRAIHMRRSGRSRSSGRVALSNRRPAAGMMPGQSM
ncbi:MAG: hypothetical protein ACLR7U_05065 [Ruthenibacterium lactatiformans]